MGDSKQFEKENLEQVLQVLGAQLGIKLQLRTSKISVTAGRQKFALNIVPIHTSNLKVAHSARHLSNLGSDQIILMPKISKEGLRKMRAAGINIFDLTGKIFIKKDGVYIFSEEEIFQKKSARKSTSLAFNTSGIKIIFSCLCMPGLIEQEYRKIAEYSITSLGSVNRVLGELSRSGYLIKKDAQIRALTKKNDLLDRWCIAYAEVLRPKITLNYYTCDDPAWWRDLDIARYGAIWGGEVAAALLTKNLKPERVTLYAEKALAKLQIEKKLKNDPKGEIEILKKFWEFPSTNKSDKIAPYLLIYADLISTGDERNDEIAEEIKNRFLLEILE